MDRPDDLKRVLAEEIRAAIAEASPDPGVSAGAIDSGTAQARGALRRAAEVLTPAVPEDAPLAPFKRLAIRAARFLWRNQSSFNSLSLAASSEIAEELDRLRAQTLRGLDELGRRSGVQEARLTLAEAAPGAPRDRGAIPAAAPPAAGELPPGVYALFEERYRGGSDQIAQGQRFYLEFLKDVPGPILDAGCGRGEFLRLLRSAGAAGSGIESNPVAVEACRSAGLDVELGDAVERIAVRPPGSLGAIVAFQVVEHWPPAVTFRFLQGARRALAPGGVLIAETINPDSLRAMRAFYLDPTHVRPVPAETLRFLAEAAGFSDIRIEYRSPVPAAERLEDSSDDGRKLNALLFGPQDYALIARVVA